MAKMHFTSLSQDYTALSSERSAMGENNDCAVVAVSIVCNVPYSVAHAALKKAGRKDRHGTFPYQTYAAIESLGKKLRAVNPREIIDTYPGVHKNLKHVTTHHPRRFSKSFSQGKVYLFSVRRHILAVKGDTVHDWSINKSKQVLLIFEVH